MFFESEVPLLVIYPKRKNGPAKKLMFTDAMRSIPAKITSTSTNEDWLNKLVYPYGKILGYQKGQYTRRSLFLIIDMSLIY